MLSILVKGGEFWDKDKEMFLHGGKDVKLVLEHSLVAIHKWEQTHNKAFFGKQEKTKEDTIDYIKCMTITQNVPDEVYSRLSNANLKDINDYITAPMTATYFYNDGSDNTQANKDTITSELIYYWMIEHNIPENYAKWHINSLLALIRVCSMKNGGSKNTMSKRDIMNRNAALNAARRKKYNSKG